MLFRTILLTGLLVTPALAQAPAVPPVPLAGRMIVDILPGDENAVRTVCDLARGASSVNLETANQITTYCLAFIQRLKSATPAPADKPAAK